MAEINNPFLQGTSPAEITRDSHETSLRVLQARYHRTAAALAVIQRAAPHSPMVGMWQAKLVAAQNDFLGFARNFGLSDEEGRQALLRD